MNHSEKRGIGGLAVFILIAVLAAAAGLVVYVIGQNSAKTAMKEIPVVTESPAASPTPTGVVSGDMSDGGLTKDSANVDTMLKSADGDSTSVDAGLNDQQGSLSEQ